MKHRYTIVLEWSEADQVYLAKLPEFPGAVTHGASYETALKAALEVLDLLIESWPSDQPLPTPSQFGPRVKA
ncbi:MAG: type II toxin-antitoxin system HicB family antitoxin [Candidatus Xenobia bacterium]